MWMVTASIHPALLHTWGDTPGSLHTGPGSPPQLLEPPRRFQLLLYGFSKSLKALRFCQRMTCMETLYKFESDLLKNNVLHIANVPTFHCSIQQQQKSYLQEKCK